MLVMVGRGNSGDFAGTLHSQKINTRVLAPGWHELAACRNEKKKKK